jgi:hypothetical protein
MSRKIPWGTRVAWYFYNNPEFFEKTDEDFENDAKELAERGITVVILFTMTHFRWSFYPYWDRINNLLRRICNAFHKYGIKVVEHHSTSLCECPLPEEEWEDRVGGIFRERGLYFTSDKARYGPYLDRWSKIKPFLCNPDSKVEGVPFLSIVQVDGRTGARSVSNYQTSTVCYNNEDFRRIYFSYLESLYKCGIDGIMTDDVQFFSGGNACACSVCRRLFKEQTGYDLPSPEEWNQGFIGNYDNPVFVAFNRFKLESAKRFQLDVDAHFRSLGYDMIRIDYFGCSLSWPNTTSYPFHQCAHAKDLIFQENTRLNVTKLSWPSYYCAAVYLYELGKMYDIPSMSVFYDSKDFSIYFGWAMSIAWGQMFNGSFPYTQETKRAIKLLHNFERRYPDIVYNQKKRADAAVFFSTDMQDIWHDTSLDIWKAVPAWLQAGAFSGLCMSIVTHKQAEQVSELSKNKIIIVPNTLMLKDSEIQNLGAYAKEGGRLVLCGQVGIYDENMRPRPYDRIKELLQSTVTLKPLSESLSVTLPDLSPMPFNTVYEGGEVLYNTDKGAACVREKVGLGEIIYIGVESQKIPVHGTARGNRPTAIKASQDAEQLARPNLAPRYAVDTLRATLGRFLLGLVSEHVLYADKQKEYFTAVFDSHDGKSRIVHLVNIKDTLQAEGTPYAFETVIRAFDIFNENGNVPEKNGAITLDVECDFTPSAVRILTPERTEPVEVSFDYGKRLQIRIPENIFSGYAAVEICK